MIIETELPDQENSQRPLETASDPNSEPGQQRTNTGKSSEAVSKKQQLEKIGPEKVTMVGDTIHNYSPVQELVDLQGQRQDAEFPSVAHQIATLSIGSDGKDVNMDDIGTQQDLEANEIGEETRPETIQKNARREAR
jgi:hypothetical protein